MAKWADYLISAVRYNSDHSYIEQVKAFQDLDASLGQEKIYKRETVVNSINLGKTFCTIYKNSENYWQEGQKVFVIKINGVNYIKTADNGTEADNLENLPEF
jgi:hypothetical protein